MGPTNRVAAHETDAVLVALARGVTAVSVFRQRLSVGSVMMGT
jgi:hypothetical protein